MPNLTEFFIKRPKITRMVIALFVLAGFLSMISLEREELPHVDMDMVKITTEYPGAAPEDVEINVTNKIEDKLLEVKNIKRLSSLSMENLSIVLVELDPESGNAEKTKTDIRNATLSISDLPETVTRKPVIEELYNDYPLIEISLSGTASERELRRYAKDLENRFRDINGVSGIQKIGYRKREIKIDANPGSLIAQSITISQIINAVKGVNIHESGGTVESHGFDKNIITLSDYSNALDVKNIIIRSNFEGKSMRLSDLAVIKDDYEEPTVLYRGNGKPGIALLVSKQEGTDIITLSDNVKKTLKEFKSTLPKNIVAEEIYDFSLLTRTMINVVRDNAIIGFVLVILVMFIFLEWRSAFWSSFGTPLSILPAMIFFGVFGITMNTAALGSLIIILGMVVDDDVIIAEKIYTLRQGGMEPVKAAIAGVKQMMLPSIATSMTVILGFLPILFIPGIMGKFIKQIPIVITLTLVFSLLETMLLLPSTVTYKAPSVLKSRGRDLMQILKKQYHSIILYSLNHRIKIICAFLLLLAVIFSFSFVFMKFKLDEDIDPDYFAVILESPRGSSLSKTSSMISDVEDILYRTVPKETLKSFSTQIGHHNISTNYIADSGLHSNFALITVYLLPSSERKITSETIMDRIKPLIKKMKDSKGFERLEIEPMGFAGGKAVEVTYITEDNALRDRLEKETLGFLKSVKGVYGTETSNLSGKNELILRLDHVRLAAAGINALDVAQTVRSAFEGAVASSIRRDGEDIEYRVRINRAKQYNAAQILELPVANSEGRMVGLKHFARIEEKPGRSAIHHFGGRRSVTITANVDESVITSFEINRMLREKFLKSSSSTPGLIMKFGGQEEETSISMRGFYFALGIAILSIFFMLVLLFNSYTQPILILSIIPFAVAGVFLVLMVHNHPLIFISLVGVLGLIGTSMNNAIIMMNQINIECRENGKNIESIANGAADRLRPILLTSLTTFAGMLPTAYGIGGDLPVIRPLVLVIDWGLIFTMFVTLILIPILYSFSFKRRV